MKGTIRNSNLPCLIFLFLDDYECGKRNKLEFITMLAPDGSLNENGAPYTGMMRYDARIKIEADLKEKGLYRGKEPNKMRLGICSRSGDILEPMISPQWYVNCDGMAKRATDAVRNGDLKIVPAEHERTWFQWLDNSRDWCVSRQLWWGHQIPAWFATKKGEDIHKTDMSHNDRWIVARSEEVRLKEVSRLAQHYNSFPHESLLINSGRLRMRKHVLCLAVIAKRLRWSATRMYLIHGSRRVYSRFLSWDGPIKPTI